MCLKLLSNTSILCRRLFHSQELDAGDWQVPRVYPQTCWCPSHLSEHMLWNAQASHQELIIYKSLSQQPGMSSLGCCSLCGQYKLNRCYKHPRGPSLPPPSHYLWVCTEMSVHKGSPGLSQCLGNFAFIPVFMVIISYSEDYSPGKVSALF